LIPCIGLKNKASENGFVMPVLRGNILWDQMLLVI